MKSKTWMMNVGALVIASGLLGGCSASLPSHYASNVSAEEREDGVTTLVLNGATQAHRRQQQIDTCGVATVRMAYALTGRPDVTEEELIRRHRKSVAYFFPAHSDGSRLLRDALAQVGAANTEENALFSWEIEDALVPGHLEWLRDRSVLVVEWADMGLSSSPRLSVTEIASQVIEGEPVIVGLTEGGEFERHAYLVVGVRRRGDELIELGVLDPMDEAVVYWIEKEDFASRLRLAVSHRSVREAQLDEKRWVGQHADKPGIYVRKPVGGIGGVPLVGTALDTPLLYVDVE